jgi:hypothetical protein
MSEQFTKAVGEIVLGVVMFIVMTLIARTAKTLWAKWRTRKDPVLEVVE